ncbi:MULTISPECIES: ATP-binding cassette domain-containing protein [unclassified Arthrobacter]|jgi:osmoprotectant transport system ATP-binding protein|uniref:ABC transporter ATP-binding protein n=1 Tax=unclassified Arthrobacter TaxID=235627 RepID=UPI0010661ECD|nr:MULTISPECIES: ATP-binding cassette domain-containing protein [unclassified Arthrobacter]BCW76427.1 proline/glycine betaine ABC transporter ATP-binding protein [Arthrobacter sp. NicSoilB11]
MDQAMIEFQSVTKQYPGGQPAVDGLSMSIAKGTVTVFVGPSGCGKTTSLRMINRMVEPTSGTITVDGRDVTTVPAAELRRSMGYVMQSAGLLPHRSVLDNIATVPRLNGVSKADARKRAEELLDVVGLAHSLGKRYPSQLSGGQQQRVGVARALAADPPVLLMDEPFSAVDPVVRDELQQELLRLQKDLAKTIVFVTHDIDEATILGDKVAVFATGGKLAQYATPEEILRAPANNFVASFVGRDRGFRHLGFTPSDGVAIHPVPTIVRSPDGYESDASAAGGWQLVVDADKHPLGWSAPGTETELVPGGSLFRPGESLRRALDAALSSPSGLGVAVDTDGTVLGVVRGGEVLALIEEARQLRQAAL